MLRTELAEWLSKIEDDDALIEDIRRTTPLGELSPTMQSMSSSSWLELAPARPCA